VAYVGFMNVLILLDISIAFFNNVTVRELHRRLH